MNRLLPPLLVDGRISGFWRAAGTARRRPLEVAWFARTRKPRRAELEEPVAALEAALDITVTEVTLTRAALLGAAIGTAVMPGVGTGAGANLGDHLGEGLKDLFGGKR